ncbi:hypothetical protein SAMN04487996_111273 [Dyadobacter soli]|uniref:Uncharacterized protein n=1 Tax=Dyadobacter soli TaxID=659014 RepID=A0A1G7MHM5_9BACT|nr:hypothetical protein [Dyadobacter soli]SDF61251.1 hypothetical protein SAMN04487996_111273 [Dyadobacter soli]
MVKESPWHYYALAVAAVIALYYGWVALKFYKTEIKKLFSPRSNQNSRSDQPVSETQLDEEPPLDDSDQDAFNEPPAWQNEQLFADVEKLVDHLSEEIEEAHQKDYTKQDLIQMLQLILKEYKMLKGTPFQIAVNNRIDAECAKYGSIHLSEGEKREVWSMV